MLSPQRTASLLALALFCGCSMERFLPLVPDLESDGVILIVDGGVFSRLQP
jgi:hypothetical protein